MCIYTYTQRRSLRSPERVALEEGRGGQAEDVGEGVLRDDGRRGGRRPEEGGREGLFILCVVSVGGGLAGCCGGGWLSFFVCEGDGGGLPCPSTQLIQLLK